MPRGLALAWFVFTSRAVFWSYAAVVGVDWGWSVASTCGRRRIKDIPKAQLARDVTGIVLCYLAPLACSAAQEAWHLVHFRPGHAQKQEFFKLTTFSLLPYFVTMLYVNFGPLNFIRVAHHVNCYLSRP